jgi:flagellar biosynthesis regulator FlaF
MNNYQRISRAYQTAGNLRSQRDRDAEVFDVFAARLRDAQMEGGMALARALAGNNNLWQTVTTVTLDDNNPQPLHVRRSMLALANSILKEMIKPKPDVRLLIEVNCNVAAGLRGVAPNSALLGGGALPGGAASGG